MIYSLEERKVDMRGTHFIAPGAVLIGSVILEEGSSVWFNAVLRADSGTIRVGAGSNIQDGAVLHTEEGRDCDIGRGVTVGHKAMLHGCVVGDDSLIGINAVVLNGARIGRNCIVGAGALVTEGKVIPDNSVVLGSPARVVRETTPEESRIIADSARHYRENTGRYARALLPGGPDR